MMKITRLSIAMSMVIALSACGGGDSDNSKEPLKEDITPDQFIIIDVINQRLQKTVESPEITITGIDSPTPISIEGGEFAVNGGTFSSNSSHVKNNDRVMVRTSSSENYSTETVVSLTVGSVTDDFNVTTHHKYTRLVSELSDKSDAKIGVITQPDKGRVVVSADLSSITFEPLDAFNFLAVNESRTVDIDFSLLGESTVNHKMTFTVDGAVHPLLCDDNNTTLINATDIPQTYPIIATDHCVSINAAEYGDGQWHAWTGDSGAQRSNFFKSIGLDQSNSMLTFKVPTGGKYHLGWCPQAGECQASYYFESDIPDKSTPVEALLISEEIMIDGSTQLTVEMNDDIDVEQFSYHWLIHQWTGSYTTLIDLITTENILMLPIPNEDNNYHVTVIADNNNFQLEGGFHATYGERLGKITMNVETVGNYQRLNKTLEIRSPDSVQKAPHLVVMIDGNPTRFEWDPKIIYDIAAKKGDQIIFDMAESSDENSDALNFTINYVEVDNPNGRYALDVIGSMEVSVCVNDGFPWSYEENPCVTFDLTVQE